MVSGARFLVVTDDFGWFVDLVAADYQNKAYFENISSKHGYF